MQREPWGSQAKLRAGGHAVDRRAGLRRVRRSGRQERHLVQIGGRHGTRLGQKLKSLKPRRQVQICAVCVVWNSEFCLLVHAVHGCSAAEASRRCRDGRSCTPVRLQPLDGEFNWTTHLNAIQCIYKNGLVIQNFRVVWRNEHVLVCFADILAPG